jgi:hypothetical protein
MNLLNEVKNACRELEDERGRHAAALMGAVQRKRPSTSSQATQ